MASCSVNTAVKSLVVRCLGANQRLPHAAAGEHADEACEYGDGGDHAEIGGNQQTGQKDSEGELHEAIADLADHQPLDAATDTLAYAHRAGVNRRPVQCVNAWTSREPSSAGL